jgi:4-hydroxy-tetrahydrodipicolinate synthase
VTQPLSQGLWGVLAMPFDDSLNVDLDSLRNEVASFGADGCGGLVALGVFGEAASLDPDEANTVASTVALSTDLPYAPTGRTDGANRRRGRGGRHKRLSTPARCDGIGILIQDYPVISGVNVTDEQVVEIVLACPFAVGVKSETPPTSVAVARLASELDVPVFGGLGGVGLLDELAAGSAGAMTGFSHPAALAAVLRNYRDEGFVAARDVWAPWLPLANFEGQLRVGLSIRKELLRRRGVIATGRVRRPAMSLPERLFRCWNSISQLRPPRSRALAPSNA